MKKDTVIYGAIGILIVGSLGLLAKNFFSSKPKTPAKEPIVQDSGVVDMINRDKQLLAGKEGAQASPSDIAQSLKRLSFSDREEILPFIKQYQKHSSPLVRAAAVEAAGALNSPELTKFLQENLSSEEEGVRIAALKGLMRHQSPEHVEIIKKHLAKLKGATEEAAWARLALARVTQDQEEREAYVSELLQNLSVDSAEIAHQVLNVFQGDKRALDFAKSVLVKTKDDDLALHAFQYDVAYNKAWLMDKLHELPMRKHSIYQSEVMAFVKKECPAKAKDIVSSLDEGNRKEFSCAR